VTEISDWGSELLAGLHWGPAVLAVAAALLWTRFRPPRLDKWGLWLAVGAGVVVAWLYSAWIEPNVGDAVTDLLLGLGLGSQLDPHPQRLIATLIEQVLALAALATVYILGQVRSQPARTLAVGQGLGIGIGAFFLQLRLPAEFAAGLSGDLLLPALAGTLMVGLHIGAAMLLSVARLSGAYVYRGLQAGVTLFLARYLSDVSDPAWQAAGLAVLALVVFLMASGASPRERAGW
jgi:hypothetical protein